MAGKKIFMQDNMCTIYKLLFHKMQDHLVKNEYEIVDTPEKADICLAGVCAAFLADEKRSLAILEQMKATGHPTYVYGCMTQVSPDRIASPLQFASWRADLLMRELTGAVPDTWHTEPLPTTFRCRSDYRIHNPRKIFIGISTGCSFQCSYCPHQKGSGSIVSLAPDDIIAQIKTISKKDIDTVILTGIDTACYGSDIGSSFGALLEQILTILDEDIDIHIAQFNPEGLLLGDRTSSDRLLTLFSDPRIRDIQLPIQTASKRLLGLMNRSYPLKKLEIFLKRLKRANPAVLLRTDLLVGFPTETLAELDKSIAYACQFYGEIAVYAFEMKPGTPLAAMGLDPIPAKEIERRRRYALDKIHAAGLLAHSGGQRIESLRDNDIIKETIRRK